ncbi:MULTISPECIES: TetR/AcrR family transcriptional regulator [unclassified Curtobacterium]|uniref:TetR/AcrR family transcriptional regulator n=1 Tax=unclassified Curtobacterium TaxID=257496 RepID=UPI000F462C19|nr:MULTISPECIES: TetR/AcrR family transcriptional regulator [unclassified Curtobacterium]NQW91243.1 TetR/AcrR family transcriptional regulator [Curtobacterium sp. VKM Ac-2861]ROS36464.1 TetR family transcriptional regulator [Curtobacterium sp. PhB78]ROS65090.1 TetR family transcriptional regulator [Curtobacterium sp. PhB172]RPE85387.1 TetR family transcriptional regulator [Curtobacterium sp. PhB137]TCL78986.1 TetR family transcriptional regulator [Curtobacterium sp. PhB128]
MTVPSTGAGRRERNKQDKLARITAAASALFAERGVDEVTTQQIADAADIGTGTLFLYAKTKGELLLMVQNHHYKAALERGTRLAAESDTALDAVMAITAPIIECNRAQFDNGRTYLREMAFGDHTEENHAAALAIVGDTEIAVSSQLKRFAVTPEAEAMNLARVVSAVLFLTMATSPKTQTVSEIMAATEQQLRAAIRPRR